MADSKMEEDKEQENEIDMEHLATKQRNIVDIIHTIKPALFFESLYGIFRFGVTNDGFVPIARKMKIFGVLLACLYVILFSAWMEIPTTITGTGTLVNVMDEIPSIVILIQYIASVITTLFFLSETTIEIFATFVELDTALCINMNEGFYKRSRSLTIKLLILLAATHLIFTIADISTDDEFKIRKLISMILYLEQDLEIFVFCKMIFMLRSRLNNINDYLMKFVQEKDTNKTPIFIINEKDIVPDKQFNFIGRASHNNVKIRDLAAMYDTIGNICSLINEVFNFQIFMNLVSTFTYVVITIWASLYYFRTPDGTSAGQLVTVIIWCILTIFSVAVMSFTCETLLTCRNNTKLLVNEIIMDYDLPRTMRVQAKVFMELIDAWPLRIFVYDMFSVDIKLMLKFVSVATTYLIVIIQISHFV